MKTIELPEKPNHGGCDPDIPEQPAVMPQETPIPVVIPAPVTPGTKAV